MIKPLVASEEREFRNIFDVCKKFLTSVKATMKVFRTQFIFHLNQSIEVVG